MSNYKNWQVVNISNEPQGAVEGRYDQGFVFVRQKNIMHQVRSLRVDLERFTLSSENRRILRKTADFRIIVKPLPLKNYNWIIHKTGAEFYRQRFGENVFSANKIKELITQPDRSNFNSIVIYQQQNTSQDIGWCIAYQTGRIFHYAYPFYNLVYFKDNPGVAMILKTILWAQNKKSKFLYLGSIWDAQARYKLQFKPGQFFDGGKWQDMKQLDL